MPPLAPDAITDGSSSSYLGGDDVVYSYTAGGDGLLNVNASSVESWVGMYVFTGCNPFEFTVGSHTSSASGTRSIEGIPVVAGETYYIVISTWPSPASTEYTLTLDGPDVLVLDPCTGTPDAGMAVVNPQTGNGGTSYVVSAQGYTLASEMSFQWESNTNDEGWQEAGDATETYTTYTATAPIEIGDEVEWRLALTCTVSEETAYSDVATFTTGVVYCEPEVNFASTGDYVSLVSSEGAVLEINYSATSHVAAYINETGMVLQAYPGQEFTLNTAYVGGAQTMGVWVDWNEDGNFGGDSNPEERLVLSNGVSPQSFDIAIPANVDNGDYRLRVRGAYDFSGGIVSEGDAFSCNAQNYGTTIDFTLSVVDPPACPAPTNLLVTNVTENSADLSWTESTTGTQWEVLYGETGFDPENEGTTVTVNNDPETTLTGLDANTNYSFYVTAICGIEDESVLAGPVSFRTACGLISSLPYLEDFDTYGTGPEAFPTCWERITYASGTNIWPSIVARFDAPSSPNTLRFQSLVDSPTYAISPQFAEDITNLRVTFMLKREGAQSGTMDVGVMSDPSDTDTFELVQTIDPADNDFNEYIFDLDQASLSGPDNYIALRHNSNSNIYFYWLDDFEVSFIPSCVEPIALTTTAVTGSTVDVEWTAGGSETSWNVSWGALGYTPGDTDEIDTATVTTTDYQITGLDLETTYDVYVRAICGTDNESIWVGPETFSTLCGVTVAPWSEDFEGGTDGNVLIEDLSCWSQEYVSATDDWKLVSQNGNGTVQPRSGSLMAEFRVATFSEPKTKLISPVLDLTELTTPQLTFYFANAAWGTDIDQLRVYYKASASDATWTLIPGAEYTTEYASWEKVELILPEGSGATDYLIAFEGTASYARGLNLDDISVGESAEEECVSPLGITVDNVREDGGVITWSPANTGDDQWAISLTTGGQSADQGLIATVTGTPSYTATGLDSETTYSVYLRTICSDEVSSDWAYNGNFTTLEATVECEAPTDVEVSDVAATTVTVNWTASATAVDGYVVDVYLAGADINTDTAIFTETVATSVTTVNVTGLTHLTSYDVYVTSDCGSGETAISDAFTFTTDDIASVGDFDFVKLTVYPNPVSTDLNISASKVIDEVQVYNILGQQVMTYKSNDSEVTIDVTRLPSATYVLKVSVEGVMSTVKFVKK